MSDEEENPFEYFKYFKPFTRELRTPDERISLLKRRELNRGNKLAISEKPEKTTTDVQNIPFIPIKEPISTPDLPDIQSQILPKIPSFKNPRRYSCQVKKINGILDKKTKPKEQKCEVIKEISKKQIETNKPGPSVQQKNGLDESSYQKAFLRFKFTSILCKLKDSLLESCNGVYLTRYRRNKKIAALSECKQNLDALASEIQPLSLSPTFKKLELMLFNVKEMIDEIKIIIVLFEDQTENSHVPLQEAERRTEKLPEKLKIHILHLESIGMAKGEHLYWPEFESQLKIKGKKKVADIGKDLKEKVKKEEVKKKTEVQVKKQEVPVKKQEVQVKKQEVQVKKQEIKPVKETQNANKAKDIKITNNVPLTQILSQAKKELKEVKENKRNLNDKKEVDKMQEKYKPLLKYLEDASNKLSNFNQDFKSFFDNGKRTGIYPVEFLQTILFNHATTWTNLWSLQHHLDLGLPEILIFKESIRLLLEFMGLEIDLILDENIPKNLPTRLNKYQVATDTYINAMQAVKSYVKRICSGVIPKEKSLKKMKYPSLIDTFDERLKETISKIKQVEYSIPASTRNQLYESLLKNLLTIDEMITNANAELKNLVGILELEKQCSKQILASVSHKFMSKDDFQSCAIGVTEALQVLQARLEHIVEKARRDRNIDFFILKKLSNSIRTLSCSALQLLHGTDLVPNGDCERIPIGNLFRTFSLFVDKIPIVEFLMFKDSNCNNTVHTIVAEIGQIMNRLIILDRDVTSRKISAKDICNEINTVVQNSIKLLVEFEKKWPELKSKWAKMNKPKSQSTSTNTSTAASTSTNTTTANTSTSTANTSTTTVEPKKKKRSKRSKNKEENKIIDLNQKQPQEYTMDIINYQGLLHREYIIRKAQPALSYLLDGSVRIETFKKEITSVFEKFIKTQSITAEDLDTTICSHMIYFSYLWAYDKDIYYDLPGIIRYKESVREILDFMCSEMYMHCMPGAFSAKNVTSKLKSFNKAIDSFIASSSAFKKNLNKIKQRVITQDYKDNTKIVKYAVLADTFENELSKTILNLKIIERSHSDAKLYQDLIRNLTTMKSSIQKIDGHLKDLPIANNDNYKSNMNCIAEILEFVNCKYSANEEFESCKTIVTGVLSTFVLFLDLLRRMLDESNGIGKMDPSTLKTIIELVESLNPKVKTLLYYHSPGYFISEREIILRLFGHLSKFVPKIPLVDTLFYDDLSSINMMIDIINQSTEMMIVLEKIQQDIEEKNYTNENVLSIITERIREAIDYLTKTEQSWPKVKAKLLKLKESQAKEMIKAEAKIAQKKLEETKLQPIIIGKKNEKNLGEIFEELEKWHTVTKKLESKDYIKGTLRVNRKNLFSCYVTDETTGDDILIMGPMHRNQAFEGDEVVISLLSSSMENGATTKKGKVVYICKKVHSRMCVGTISEYSDAFLQLKPRDPHVPKVLLEICNIPEYKDLIKNDILYSAKIVKWDLSNYCLGHLIQPVGPKGFIEAEKESNLIELGIDWDDFGPNFDQFLPKFPYVIPENVIKERLDLRDEIIFSIDPETAKDLDDALSIKRLPDGLFEVGVHIADPTYFLTEGTELDKAVFERGTSVYLVDKVIHMLPFNLCLLCSLLPGEDKLSVSVIWKMDDRGNIKETKFYRSVMRSCAQLSYDHAQAIIENRDVEFPRIFNGKSLQDVKNCIKDLYGISTHIRDRRFRNGALKIDQTRVSFQLDQELKPIKKINDVQKDSNRMIEDYMLLANETVAKLLNAHYPKLALLRRHPPPKFATLQKVVDLLKCAGINLNPNSAGELYQSMIESSKDESHRIFITSACVKVMKRALYFCDMPEDTHHYALNLDLYTHFTSPIRRYADIIVHRLLMSLIDSKPKPDWTSGQIKKLAEHLNKMTLVAKQANEMSVNLYKAVFIKNEGFVISKGVVVNVLYNSFEVKVDDWDVLFRIYTKDIKGETTFYEDGIVSYFTVKWEHIPEMREIRLFDVFEFKITSGENLVLEAELILPS